MSAAHHHDFPRRGFAARYAAVLALLLALLLGLFLSAPAAAQSDATIRTLERPSEVLGIPPVRIDLSVAATRRIALVIGNGDYEHAPDLPNAVADARLVAEVFGQSGYSVDYYENLERRGFEAALRRLISDTGPDTEVVIYYAGHGVQIGASNRLIPVDAELASVYDLPFSTVSLSSLLSIAGARARSLVVILDSCRDNPFPGRDAILGLDRIPQSLQSGFAAQDSPVNSLVVFATSPGARALDGLGGHSPFTESLVAAMRAAPDAALDDVLKDTRRRVYQMTGGLQVPWESSSLVEVVRFDGDPGQPGFQNAGAGLAPMPADPSPAGEVALTLPLDRRVAVGTALMGDVAAAGEMVLTRAPRFGRLELRDGQRTRGLTMMTAVGAGFDGLIYATSSAEITAADMPGDTLTDSFDVETDGKVQSVQLTLEADPCDLRAGDHLDPDGVGVGRYPNEIEVAEALRACTEAVARSPDVGRFHYQLGRVHLAMRNLDQAEREFTLARDLDYTRAWHALGMLEIQRAQETGGRVIGGAPETALALLAIGVDRGDPYAFHSLGLQLLRHADDPALKRQGFELENRALEVGHTFAMNSLGTYFLQEGTEHFDPQRGLHYFRESAARGDIYGFDNMGYVHLNGWAGVSKDARTALDWFTKASDGGHPTAPSAIGRIYNSDALGRPDYAEAVRWFDLGLSRGDGWGGANAAWIIANRRPAGFGPGEAAARAAKAMALRDPEAAASAGEVLDGLSASEIDAGAQILMGELGETLTADGAFGPASTEALARIAARFGTSFPDDRQGRLKALAALYWTTNKFRVDLY